MSFEDTILPPFLIADLYKNVLIEDVEKKVVEVAKPIVEKESSISFLGSNNKNVVIMVSDNTAVHIADEKLQLLTNLLTACKLGLADVAIVNVSNKNIVYKQVKQAFQPKNLLLMGVDAKQFQLPLVFPEYRIQHYDNCQMLIAPNLNNLLGSTNEVKVEKSKLWVCLKEMFGV